MTDESVKPSSAATAAADTVVQRAIDKTPSWVWAFCGGMITLSVCVVFVLQVGGFSSPLQRIMNAKATEIERAAESITASAKAMEIAVSDVDQLKRDVTDLKVRMDKVDKYHGQ